MENPRCSYRHSGFYGPYNSNSFSAFTSDNLHNGSDQCWMEGEHVGNFGTEDEPEYFCIFHAPEDKEPPPGFSKDEREASQPGVLKELL
ncbi:MAG TPA: hypothetical protein ENI77_11765, partial [Nitrospirae bacterium]|nr:hypothetical protein [Nitrospirota bacterium]